MTLSLKVMSLQTEQTLPKAIAVAPFAFEMSFVKAAERIISIQTSLGTRFMFLLNGVQIIRDNSFV